MRNSFNLAEATFNQTVRASRPRGRVGAFASGLRRRVSYPKRRIAREAALAAWLAGRPREACLEHKQIMLTVGLFGHVHLAFGGKNLPFAGRPKVVPLLAYLLLNCRQAVSRDDVAFALWPDETEASARANLRRHLHYLRELLPASRTPWFISDTRTVRWNPAAQVRVDTADFEEFAGNPESLESAVALYGEILQGYDDEWLLGIRERLHRSYVQSLFELVRRARGRRDCASASDYLRRILADDPWREDALRALMIVRCESGDSSSALQICAAFEARLSADMGTGLMPETVALRRAIERGIPLPGIPVVPGTAASIASTIDLPFEGRTDELERLRDIWQKRLSGSGALSLVLGEAGIGKTRLVSEFAVQAEATGARVFWGTTASPEVVPYQPITEILRAALGFIERSNREAYDLQVLSRLVPELQEQGLQTDPGGEPPAEKLFDVVADLFIELARPRPALFVLEDLHAAGQATIALLEHIAQRCSAHPVTIVATLREGEPHTAEILGRLRRPPDGPKPSVVPIGPLSEIAARSIAGQVLEQRSDANRIAARAAGQPLFLAQLLYAAKAQNLAIEELPAGLRESIHARTEPLSPPASFLLRAAAVAGNAFDLEIIGESLGWSESQLATAADELVARRLIRETARSRAFEFEFAHDLIASAAYESLEERERRRLHRRTARACERWYASRLVELAAYVARHFELGGERDSAVFHYLTASKNAANAFANAEALGHARRALDLRPSSPTATFDLLCVTEEVLARTGDRTEQRAVLRSLDRVARRLGDVERLREVLRRRETFHRYLAEYDAAARVLAQLHRLAAGSPRWEAIALCGDAVLLHNRASIGSAYETAARAVTSAQAASDTAVLVEALSLTADYAGELDRRNDAKESLRLAKDAVASTTSLLLSMRVLYCELTVLGRFQAWSSIVKRGPALLDLAAKVGSRVTAANAHTLLGAAECCLFEFDSARRHLHQAIELYRGCDSNSLLIAYFNLSTVEEEVGQLDNAQAALDAINAILDESNNPLHRAAVTLSASGIAYERGHYATAIDFGRQAVASASMREDRILEAAALRLVGMALEATGKLREAVDHLERSFAIFQSSKVSLYTKRAAAVLARAYAIAHDPRASSFADEAVRICESVSTDSDSPVDWWALAQALEALGRQDEAHATLCRAHRAFETSLKRLRNPLDRVAFSQLRDNAELERAYASVVASSGDLDANVGTPRVHRAPKTRTARRLRPREQFL